ncbi:MAG: hypothetical protein ACK4TP_10130 [Hyphomicrobium sp.]
MSKTDSQAPAPITVGELAKQGRGIIAECQDCGHTRMLGSDAVLKLDPRMPVTEVHKRLRCGCCNSKLILCMPQSDRDAKKGRAR